jgi:hypothetical protein
MSVPFRALNFDADGNRVPNPVQYGTFVKRRGQEPGTGYVKWSSETMPTSMLVGLRDQLRAALVHIEGQLEFEDETS